MAPDAVTVSIDLARIRRNAEAILARTRVPLIAVVKADAYGLGAEAVAATIGDLVDAFYVFHADEAVTARLWEISRRRTLAVHADWTDPADFTNRHIHPLVWTTERARQLRQARPVLAVDTGQQRFACPASAVREVCQAGDCREAMTHAIALHQVNRLRSAVKNCEGELFLHAAASALLDEPQAWLNAVRPGLALYEGAVSVSARLVEVHDSTGPAGYSGFSAPRFGIILAGYSSGLRRGLCRVNGQIRPVLEVGMQSAFVELGSGDKAGDAVELLGSDPNMDLGVVSAAWGCSKQEVLVRCAKIGVRKYVSK
jgi:alanine racemase